MKCVFGFTPVPGCGNCGGTGIFAEDDDGNPEDPCVFCWEDAIRMGEVDGCFAGSETIIEDGPLSFQRSFYLLSNGVRYAKYGEEVSMEEPSVRVNGLGLLAFLSLDSVYNFLLTKPQRAKEFSRMNGADFSEFTPCKVANDDLLPIVKEYGGILIVPYRLGMMAAWLREEARSND